MATLMAQEGVEGEYQTLFGIVHGLYEAGGVKYACICSDIAPQTGANHAHAFVQFESARQLSTWRTKFPLCHLDNRSPDEREDGSETETERNHRLRARNYVMGIPHKGNKDNFHQWGTWSSQGQRTDLAVFMEVLLSQGLTQAASDFPGLYFRYGRNIHNWTQLTDRRRSELRTVKIHVLWGETGTGKSHRAWEGLSNLSIGTPWIGGGTNGSTWYAYGYESQKAVILDEFHHSWMPITSLLRYLDKYPASVNVSGRGVHWLPTHIVITSQTHPQDWYPNAAPARKRALMRRLGFISEVRNQEQEITLFESTDGADGPPVAARAATFVPDSLAPNGL